jgi:hypothetical protein
MKLPGRRSPRLGISGGRQSVLETIICLSSIILPTQEGDRL